MKKIIFLVILLLCINYSQANVFPESGEYPIAIPSSIEEQTNLDAICAINNSFLYRTETLWQCIDSDLFRNIGSGNLWQQGTPSWLYNTSTHLSFNETYYNTTFQNWTEAQGYLTQTLADTVYLNLSGTNANQNTNISPYDFEADIMESTNSTTRNINISSKEDNWWTTINGYPDFVSGQSDYVFYNSDRTKYFAVDLNSENPTITCYNGSDGLCKVLDNTNFLNNVNVDGELTVVGNVYFNDWIKRTGENTRIFSRDIELGNYTDERVVLHFKPSYKSSVGGTTWIHYIDSNKSIVGNNSYSIWGYPKDNAGVTLAWDRWMEFKYPYFSIADQNVTREMELNPNILDINALIVDISHVLDVHGISTFFSGVIGKLFSVDQEWIIHDGGDNLTLNESKLNNSIDNKLTSIYYNGTESTAIAGTITGGCLLNTTHDDGNYDSITMNFTEQAGSPGLDLRVNFTGVDSFNRGIMRYRTSNLIGDYPIRQLWNHNTLAWENYPTLATSEGFSIVTQPIFTNSNYLNNNVVQMRMYKSANGNTNNDYEVDWITVVGGVGIPSGSEVDPYSWKRDIGGESGNFNTTGNLSVGGGSIQFGALIITQNTTYLNISFGGLIGCIGNNCT